MSAKKPHYDRRHNRTTSANGHTIELRNGIYYVDGHPQPSGVEAKQLFRQLARQK